MTRERLQADNEELRRRLDEAEETLRAIREGAVDGFVVAEPTGHRVYTLEGADRPYRLLVEEMQQGAATLLADGTIVWCNRRLAELLRVPHEKLTGAMLHDFFAPEERAVYDTLLWQGQNRSGRGEAQLRRTDGRLIPAYLTFSALPKDCGAAIGVLVTDLTARKHQEQLVAAHKALRESEERFRLMADAVPVLIWVSDASKACTWFNQSWLDFSGHSMQELLGDGWAQDVHPDDLDRCVSTYSTCFDARLPFSMEYRLKRHDGQYRWIVDNGISRFDPDGHFFGYIGSCVDFTERMLAEQALRDRERELSDFFESASIGLHWVGPDGVIMRVNQAELDMLGYTKDEFIGRHIAEFHVDRGVIEDILGRLGRGEILRECSARLRCKDGTVRDVLINSSVLFVNGQFVHTRCFTTDITERRAAAEALRENEERYRTLASVITDVPWTADPAGQFVVPQEAYARYTGKSWEELRGAGWIQCIHPDDREQLVRAWDHAVTTGGKYKVSCREWHGPTQQWRHVIARGTPVFNSDGSVREWVGSLTDVEEQYRGEQILREADRRKDEFLATLAHELRGPLAPIANMLTILRRGNEDPDVFGQALSTMQRQFSHLVRLVDDLLDVSRISRGRIELKRVQVELASVLYQAIESCRPLAERAKHEVEVSFPPDPIFLYADPVRLTQVFSNLLNNSCKYTESGGKISVVVEQRGADVVVRVKDTGVGIPPDKLSGIFEMFAQMDSSLERSQGGLGIGLSLAKRLVELHGGSVEGRSEGAGRGSEFMVRLPVLPHKLVEKTVASTALPKPANPRRILVVDDNQDSARSLALLLKLGGDETRLAHDGLEAVEVAGQFRPEVILLDIGLPKLNGFEVCQRIRQQPWGREIMLVALTGWGQEADRRRSKDAGFDAHLVKPVDYDDLQALLARSAAG